TGATSLTADQVLYTNHAGTGVVAVATSTPTITSGLAYSGTGGYFIGGSSGNLTLAAINSGMALANNTSGSAIPTSVSTSTWFGAGTTGQILQWDAANNKVAWIATTTFTGTAPVTATYASGGLTIACATCLTGNQSITLSGAVTGTGATSITTA